MQKNHLAGDQLLSRVLSVVQDFIPEQTPELQEEITRIIDDYEVYPSETIKTDSDIQEKIEMFIASKKLEGLSKKTIEGYQRELDLFSKVITKKVEDIKAGDIRLYLGKIDVKMSTLGKKLSTIRTFFHWLTLEEIIDRDPAIKIKPPKVEKRPPKALTIEELEMMREGCQNQRERAFIEVLYSTGCRISEIANLNRSDINFNTNSAKVIGKGNEMREVYFSFKSIHHLKKYLLQRSDQSDALFISSRKPNSRLSVRTLQQMIAEIGENAGINKHVTPHMLRHTFATLTLNNGAEIAAVQALLGHKNPATTMIYSQLTEERKKESHKKHLVQ